MVSKSLKRDPNTYYQVVFNNLSEDVVNSEVFTKTRIDFEEIVFEMHRLDIPENRAVVIIERFYESFKKHYKNGKRKRT